MDSPSFSASRVSSRFWAWLCSPRISRPFFSRSMSSLLIGWWIVDDGWTFSCCTISFSPLLCSTYCLPVFRTYGLWEVMGYGSMGYERVWFIYRLRSSYFISRHKSNYLRKYERSSWSNTIVIYTSMLHLLNKIRAYLTWYTTQIQPREKDEWKRPLFLSRECWI